MNHDETTMMLDLAERVVDTDILSAQLDILTGIMLDSLGQPELSDVNRGALTAAGLCIAAVLIDKDCHEDRDDFDAAVHRVEYVLGDIIAARVRRLMSGEPEFNDWDLN